MTFGKGSRYYLSMNLAYFELYLTLFAVFGGGGAFELELFETDDRDVEVKRDFFTAVPELGTKGIRAVVK